MDINVGDKFGHWTVIGEAVKGSGYHKNYLCQCDCEEKTRKYVDEQNLKRGLSLSCGCVTKVKAAQRFTRHGLSKKRLFHVWVGMTGRCYNQTNTRYKDYGGRGIAVCPEWKNDFVAFYEWAMATGYNEDAKYGECTLDRINVDGNYEPDNCRWVSIKKQSNNRRNNIYITYSNETHTVTEWSKITGISRATLTQRYRKGLPLSEVFFHGNLKQGEKP